jgi:hypothetical protein
MKKVIAFHMKGLRAEGLKVPPPRSSSTYVDIRG